MIHVQRLRLTPEKFLFLWHHVEQLGYRTLNDDAKEPKDLWNSLARVDSIHFEITENEQMVGYACLAAITEWNAVAHITFFDKHMSGREYPILKALQGMMEELGLKVIQAYLPLEHVASRAWLERMGWQYDGFFRQAMRRKGQLLDVGIFSMTKEEVDNGTIRWAVGTRSSTPATRVDSSSSLDATDYRENAHSENGSRRPSIFRRLAQFWRKAGSKTSTECQRRSSV